MAILGPDGKPFQSEPAGLPEVHRQPPLQITGRFTTKQQFEAVIQFHKFGFFQQSSWLVEQMMTAAPVASAMQTRCDRLTGTGIQFLPGRNNDKGRRAARDLEEEDFSLIAPATARAQMHAGSLMSGVKLAQKHWFISQSSGRQIPQVEPWSNIWAMWDWATWAYRVWTWDAGWRLVPSPSLMVPGEKWKPTVGSYPGLEQDDPRVWVVSEPFGPNSWSADPGMALLYSLWEPYFGWALANNDANAVCEQQGRGQRLLKYPKVSANEKPRQDEYINGLINLGSNAVIPLEQQGIDVEQQTHGYELEAFEYPANGWTIIEGVRDANANLIYGRILGHNTQGETKGAAGAGGGAHTGAEVRADIAVADTLREFRWLYLVLRDWAAANYGDPGLAPIPLYDVDEPITNVQAGQTAQFISAALAELDRFGVDTSEYLRRARMPLRLEAQAPGWKPPPKPAPETKAPTAAEQPKESP
jgi:hypothetical protein